MKRVPTEAGRQLHKFGGSNLTDAQGYQRVAAIIAQYSNQDDLIVVSAAGNTTNQLINWLTFSSSTSNSATIKAYQLYQKLYQFQRQLINRLLPPIIANQLSSKLEHELTHLKELLPSAAAEIGGAAYAEIVGQGEIWSARLLAELINWQGLSAIWLDARDLLRAERSAQPKIDEGRSYLLLSHRLAQHPQQRIVITGFISRNRAGETVLLGRNGSDYSATQIGALANVRRVTIWRDVAGIYSADPYLVPEACLLPQLRLDEACELARLATPVLHARTLQPLSSSSFELQLRSCYQPEQGSTRIERTLASGSGAKIITSYDNACLIELSMLPEHDLPAMQQLLATITQQLQQVGIPPLTWYLHADRLLLQWCYPREMVDSALKLLQTLAPLGAIQHRQGISMIAVVGNGVVHHPRHRAQFFQQIKDQPLEHLWQAQGGHSLAAILRSNTSKPLLEPLHRCLWGSHKRIGLVLFGKGLVGSQWLALFAQQQKKSTAHNSSHEFVLSGVIHGERCWLDHQGLDANHALAFFDSEAHVRCEQSLHHWLCQHPFDHLVILDTTASPELINQYREFAGQGMHLITTNILTGSLSSEVHVKTTQAFKRAARHWLYSGTFGAGLPINHTIRDLRDSGDTLLTISGSFCSALSQLFQQCDSASLLTEQMQQVWRHELTLTDPRVDLSGTKVTHQLVMLARAAGYRLEAAQVRVESLVPPTLAAAPLEAFFEKNNPINHSLQQRIAAASAAGLVLRYIARFNTKEGGRVGIEALAPQHPLAMMMPYEQVFVVESNWYRDPPLVIRGPGNGADAMAGTLQADLNRLSQLL